MKWEEISEQYPKAYTKACEWGKLEGWDSCTEDGLMTFIYDIRHLYDFFDSNGIYIELVRASDWWYYLGCLKAHDTRTEAEEGAFIEAFKMLERKLNK